MSTVTVAMVMASTAQKPGACDVNRQTEAGDWNRFGEMNRDRGQNAGHRFESDQDRDHRQDYGAGEAGKIAEFAGSEGKVRVFRMLARVCIGKRRHQKCARMR